MAAHRKLCACCVYVCGSTSECRQARAHSSASGQKLQSLTVSRGQQKLANGAARALISTLASFWRSGQKTIQCRAVSGSSRAGISVAVDSMFILLRQHSGEITRTMPPIGETKPNVPGVVRVPQGAPVRANSQTQEKFRN